MRKDRVKKFISIFVLITILFLVNIDNIFGAINTEYYNDIKGSMEVDNTYVDKSAESSPLLDAIAMLVYAVGAILEKILGYIFELISGDNVFPWADAILFNAIPMLDINVFNPSQASLIATLQSTISNTYWTVFTLALAFFGIAVMVTAIKLAVSTIASDKALYKQAIVRWLMGFIMLCGIHFFISFAIYLNEQLVIAAQNIASDAIDDTVIDIEKIRDTDEQDYAIVENFLNAMTTGYTFNWVAATTVLVITAVVVGISLLPFIPIGAAGIAAIIASGTGAAAVTGYVQPLVTVALTQARVDIDNGFISKISTNQAIQIITENYEVSAKLLNNSEYVEILERRAELKLVEDSEKNFTSKYRSEKPVKLVAADVSAIISKGSSTKFTIDLDESGEKVEYIKFLQGYVNGIDSLESKERITKKYKTDSFDEYQVSYHVLEVDGDGNEYLKEMHCSSSGSMSCEDNINFVIDIKDNNEVTLVTGNPDDYVNCDVSYYNHAKIMIDMYDRFDPGTGKMTSSGTKNTNIISALADTFKKMAWENTETSWKPVRANLEGALLYAILVAQSLIFFISYAKRLFYIIILIVMAPVVVVYDFFTKFSS